MPRRTSAFVQRASLRNDIEVDFESHPFSVPAVRNIADICFHPNVTFFVGENGSGKSTVLEAIAMALGFGSEGGTLNHQFRTTESVSSLHGAIRIARGVPKPYNSFFLRAESFFNVATYIDAANTDEQGRRSAPSLHECSHGEAFMAVLLKRLRGDGIYLMDEPEAALSPSRQLAALRAIHQLVEASCQFIIATHSPILLAYPHARIIRFDESGVQEVGYEDTEHFAITKDFLNHWPARLESLLKDDDEPEASGEQAPSAHGRGRSARRPTR